jgi:hypothetical protein
MTDTERAELIRDATARLAYAIAALAQPDPKLATASNDADAAANILNRLYRDKRAREAA